MATEEEKKTGSDCDSRQPKGPDDYEIRIGLSKRGVLRVAVFAIVIGLIFFFGSVSSVPPYKHYESGYFLHNDSGWPITLRIEDTQGAARRVRLQSKESLVMPQRPAKVSVLLRSEDPERQDEDRRAIEIDLTKEGVVGTDYGVMQVTTGSCLTIGLRLGQGLDAPVDR
jgi:hypothetical protein